MHRSAVRGFMLSKEATCFLKGKKPEKESQ
jgi:hypothetical protein